MSLFPENLVVVGAGFSFNAGLPLASGFTADLLDVSRFKLNGPSRRLVDYVAQFVGATFSEGRQRDAEQWPELEDIFTVIDLSANTGHHLGPNYSASDLRVVRRALIVRMIRMLSQLYSRRQQDHDDNWQMLEQFFSHFDVSKTAVLSMNWDTVVEQGLARTQGIRNVDYGCFARAAKFSSGKLSYRRTPENTVAHVLKPHGSVNWLYCDACRETLWVQPSETISVARTLFRRKDWTAVMGKQPSSSGDTLDPTCPHCNAKALGTRFATFSYRKALDFPMHAASWRSAERFLKDSSQWVFFGYSMPAADYEFKLLLKRVQLSEAIRPCITVVTGGTDADTTVERFEKFFGKVSRERTYFRDGLNQKVLDHLNAIGVLRPTKVRKHPGA